VPLKQLQQWNQKKRRSHCRQETHFRIACQIQPFSLSQLVWHLTQESMLVDKKGYFTWCLCHSRKPICALPKFTMGLAMKPKNIRPKRIEQSLPTSLSYTHRYKHTHQGTHSLSTHAHLKIHTLSLTHTVSVILVLFSFQTVLQVLNNKLRTPTWQKKAIFLGHMFDLIGLDQSSLPQR
jgi:hypothetical protein